MKRAIAKDTDRLQVIAPRQQFSPKQIEDWLRQDRVVLLRGVETDKIDNIIASVADRFDLRSGLELQASFAAIKKHREKISRYYMSVNKRNDYQCILPHSEGGSFANMQLVSFFCYQNTTDGGYSILMNVDDSSALWDSLREQVKRGKSENRQLTNGEMARARMQYHLHLPEDFLQPDDRVLRERKTDIDGLTIVDALVAPRKTYSKILDEELFVFWSSMKSTKADLSQDFVDLLRNWGIYIEPPADEGHERVSLSDSHARRGERTLYEQLFKDRIVHKMEPGDLIVMNNQTWTHAASNWTPESGIRDIGVAIA